ncbi:unnamed protein product [Echinostoma caproni]|uniref:Septin-type G domain-containing protein n=1 Tax=Echinostoma caproni TaxID=27848 RepID=A0A183B345_9TREM|nr:unnamed protein product [Echinostoma caproni]
MFTNDLPSYLLPFLQLYPVQGPSKRNTPASSTRVDTRSFELCEGLVKLRLCISDTPGFGQGVDNSTCWQPIVDYLDQQFEAYLKSELSVTRTTVGSGAPYSSSLAKDSRVHVCIYFVAPSGHGLHQLDIETLKHLHSKVNPMNTYSLFSVPGLSDTIPKIEGDNFCLQL